MLRNKKDVFKRLVLFILSTFFVLFILEIFLRLTCPVEFQSIIDLSRLKSEEMNLNKANFRPSRLLGYEFIPNSELIPDRNKLGINSLGMHNKERFKEKQENTYRIICIGDSTTAWSDYTNILEELLNSNKSRERFEVWNCGVPGYGVIQYCRALKEKWLMYNPDRIIIGFCLNDFDTTPLVLKESDVFVRYFPYREIIPGISTFLFKNSALYRFVIIRAFISNKTHYDKDIVDLSHSYLKQTKELLSEKIFNF